MVGYPIELFKDKYERKCIEFNLGIMIDAKEYQQHENLYSVLLRKAGKVLIDLEEECEFVWSEKYKVQILKFIKAIYENLQQNLWTHCQITTYTALQTKLLPLEVFSDPLEPLNNYDVPIFIKELNTTQIKDFGILYIIELIDGIKSIQHLASTVNINIVKNAIRYLKRLGCIALIDIFQYRNSYALNNIKGLIDSTDMQKECMEYIEDDSADTVTLYRDLTSLSSVEEFVNRYLKVNARRLVAYGIVNKIIRRIHHHVYVKEGSKREEVAKKLIELADASLRQEIKLEHVKQMLNGSMCLDEMALKLRIPSQEIKKVALKFNGIIFPK